MDRRWQLLAFACGCFFYVGCGEANRAPSSHATTTAKPTASAEPTVEATAIAPTTAATDTKVIEEFHADGSLATRRSVLVETDGKEVLHGETGLWNRYGQRLREDHFEQGKEQGIYRRWSASGQLIEEGHYKNGLRDGVQRKWNEQGQLLSEISLAAGLHHGPSKIWYPNGQLHYEVEKEHGQFVGVLKSWRSDGSPLSQIECVGKGGPEVPSYTQYWDAAGRRRLELWARTEGEKTALAWPTGKPLAVQDANKTTGRTTEQFWYSSGQLAAEVHRQQGTLQSDQTKFFDPAGQPLDAAAFAEQAEVQALHTELRYVMSEYIASQDNLNVNVQDIWSADIFKAATAIPGTEIATTPAAKPVAMPVTGEPKVLEEFHPDGSLASRRSVLFDAQGNEVLHGETGTWNRYGQRLKEDHYEQGLCHGVSKTWSETGQLLTETPYKHDLSDGPFRRWNEQGLLVGESNRVAGHNHGRTKAWFPDGKPRFESHFDRDQSVGTWICWRADGSKYLEIRFKTAEQPDLREHTIYFDVAERQLLETWNRIGSSTSNLTRSDGSKLAARTYDRTSRRADEQCWYANGQLAAQVQRVGDKLQSEQAKFFDSQGQPLTLAEFAAQPAAQEMYRQIMQTIQEYLETHNLKDDSKEPRWHADIFTPPVQQAQRETAGVVQ